MGNDISEDRSPKTELITCSRSSNDPSISQASLIELSHCIRWSQTVTLYNQKIRQVTSSGRPWVYIKQGERQIRKNLTKNLSSMTSVAPRIKSSNHVASQVKHAKRAMR